MDAIKIIGGNGERRALDFYPTPPEVTKALLDFLLERRMIRRGDVIWEPACGNMAMVDVMEEYGFRTIATDIALGQDFMTHRPQHGTMRWIITNPPFSMAEQFIRRAEEFDVPFALLLKSQYWHSARRKPLFDEFRPDYVMPLTWRPDFTGKGSSMLDMIWCIWSGESGSTQYIPLARPGRNDA